MEGRTLWGISRRSAIGITPSRSGTPDRHACYTRPPGTLGWRSPRGAGLLGTSRSWPKPSLRASMVP
eukprot:3136143-Lingulodinium_polyedra.AAC.1